MISTEVIEKMRSLNLDDKVNLLDILWEDISGQLMSEEIPQSHLDELEKRLHLIDSGNETFDTWDNVKNRILHAK